jgi:hypothetical protein
MLDSKEVHMVKYTVLNAIRDSSACPDGRQHISGARIAHSPGVLLKASLDKLLGMQQDTFVTPDPDNVRADVAVSFEPCACGTGFVVEPVGVVAEFNN